MSPAHTPPLYCPYCGEEDIRPAAEGRGDWGCESCRRVWSLRFLGIGRPPDLPFAAPAAGGTATTAAATRTDTDPGPGKGA
ncbi:MAG TPA: hypothetical protein VGR21_05385 [Cryptosporangiaceae bacterium]|nr:hypothetical protein [Cryptosporangiaceae bacterium]